MKNIKRVFSYISPKKKTLVIFASLVFIASLISSMAPLIQGMITAHLEGSDGISSAINMKTVFKFALTLITMYAVTTALRIAYYYVITTAIQGGMKKLRSDIQKKIHLVPVQYYDSHLLGEVSSRITTDIETISNGFQQSMVAIISSVVSVVLIVIMMFTVKWQIGLVVLAIFPIIFLLAFLIIRKTSALYRKQQHALGKFQGTVQEKYTGFKEITVYGKQEDAISELTLAANNLSDIAFKAQFISGLMDTFVSLIIFMLIGTIAALGVYVLDFDVAELQPLILYSWFMKNPLSQITQLFSTAQVTAAASNRVFSFIDETQETPDEESPLIIDDVKGEVTFKDVSFGYHQDNLILKGLSFVAKPGQTIAVVGPTGAGKTTLINLLMRFYDINEGDILLDGHSIYQLKRADLREVFGMVLQDTWLFKGTIYENIRYGNQNATKEEVIAAAKLANIHHTIETLPKGYEMLINEEADNISQGEKQLLTIARAILANPKILILDEATSTVDTRLEHRLQAAMNELMQNRTSFVIAHRLSTIRNADQILVIDDGQIIERGNHDELIASNGFYKELYNSQFQD